MYLKFDHNLCAQFSQLKKAGFDDAVALKKMNIKPHWAVANKLCNWHFAKFKREQEIKKKIEDLADDYFELKANGMPSEEKILEQLNSDNKKIVYDKKKIINKIIELNATKNSPLWIIKYFNVSPYTAGLIHRELNNS